MSINTLFFIVIVFNCVILMTINAKACRYWCKTDNDEFYCCPTGSPDKWISKMWSPIFWFGILGYPITWPQFHIHSASSPSEHDTQKNEKNCPPIRSVCSRKFDWDYSLELCHNDTDCDKDEKCCFDICIDEKVCKPAE